MAARSSDSFIPRPSSTIVIRESTDLVHWTDPRLVEVAPEGAGNAWAPEACYDRGLGAYVVYWASRLRGSTYNTMLYATTKDFRVFSAPQVWHDPGHSVIDSTVLEHDGTYYRYTKDERDPASGSPGSKFITAEKSPTLELPIHLDINVPDREAELQRILELGGKLVETKSHQIGELSEIWTVMRDPEEGWINAGRAEPVLT